MASPGRHKKATKSLVSSRLASCCYLLLFALISVALIPSIFDALLSPISTTTRSIIEQGEVVASNGSIDATDHHCDLSRGEWVPNPEGRQHYSIGDCPKFQEHFSCVQNGRPDVGFTKWKWRPAGASHGCDIQDFDPLEFLAAVKGKSLAFVGDSIARNQLESLVCLLWEVEHPEDLPDNNDDLRHYRYKSSNFTLAFFWSPYLVRAHRDAPQSLRYNIYLDEPDKKWTTEIHHFDFVIISAGQWFYRPLYYHKNGTPFGCTYTCENNSNNLTALYPLPYGYRAAFRSAFNALLGRELGFKGTVFLRTFSPGHFEGGEWNTGGDCPRTQPWKSASEITVEDYVGDQFYKSQVEEFNVARESGKGTGVRFGLLDVTKAMLLRPDGHLSKYRHPDAGNSTGQRDCTHWCLPGPIDYWNSLLLQMIKRS